IALGDPTRFVELADRHSGNMTVLALGQAGWDLWSLGYPDRALARTQEGVALARQHDHLLSLSIALTYESAAHCLRRDRAGQRRCADEASAISEAQHLPLTIGLAKVFGGSARVIGEGDTSAVGEVSEGLALAAGTGMQGGAPAILALLADTH